MNSNLCDDKQEFLRVTNLKNLLIFSLFIKKIAYFLNFQV